MHGGDLPETKDSLRKGQDDLKEQARQWNDARMLETLERGRAREDGSEGSADKEAMQQEMQNLIHTLEVPLKTTHELFSHQTHLSTQRMHYFRAGFAIVGARDTCLPSRMCEKICARRCMHLTTLSAF